jgi:hypothetical protein
MADTKKTKTETASEPKTESAIDQVTHAASAWTETLREAGKAVADSAVAIQSRNAQFTQSLVEQGFKQVEDQTKALHSLYTTVASQSDARRAAFRELAREATSASMTLLASPAKIYRRAIERVREAGERDESGEA